MRLICRWADEVECDCGKFGWEWDYSTDTVSTTIASVLSPLTDCTCTDMGIIPGKWSWMWDYPFTKDSIVGSADTFEEAVTALHREGSRHER